VVATSEASADREHTGELPAVSHDDTGGPPRPRRFRPLRLSLKLIAFVVVLYFVIAQVPKFRQALRELANVDPLLLILGLVLEAGSLVCYSLLTKAALGEGGKVISRLRLFRIQMSTKALSNIVPGGSAAGPALGYRLMTLSGVEGPDAGFALATAGLGSAVVLNLLLWVGLIVSIPIRGVNKGYGLAAVAGIILMLIAGFLVFALMEGQGRAERILRWIARKLHMNEDRAGAAVRQVGARLEDLARDKQLLLRVFLWAAANWILDAASLWVFLRAFGSSVDFDALIIAFGLVNVALVIPITPGGIGVFETAMVGLLVGFGLPKAAASLGVISYRLAQYWLPTLIGGALYASLRIGPWSIERRDRLMGLRQLAAQTDSNRESSLDFAARFARRNATTDRSGEVVVPAQVADPPLPPEPPVTG
jgi:putative heme transporter